MDRTWYELNDAKFYRKQDEARVSNQIQQRVTTCVQRMLKDGHIAEMTKQYLIHPTVIVGRFYILSKINKTANPGLPIITSNSNPTERISQFVDYHRLPNPLSSSLDSHVKDWKFGRTGKAVETLVCGLFSHSISRSPKLPLVFL